MESPAGLIGVDHIVPSDSTSSPPKPTTSSRYGLFSPDAPPGRRPSPFRVPTTTGEGAGSALDDEGGGGGGGFTKKKIAGADFSRLKGVLKDETHKLAAQRKTIQVLEDPVREKKMKDAVLKEQVWRWK